MATSASHLFFFWYDEVIFLINFLRILLTTDLSNIKNIAQHHEIFHTHASVSIRYCSIGDSVVSGWRQRLAESLFSQQQQSRDTETNEQQRKEDLRSPVAKLQGF